jgi:hypothetical protein
MNFSLSTFVVEVNSKAQIAFQTKWHGDAEQIGRDWVAYRSDRWEQDRGRTSLPPIVKIRVATSQERAAYEDDSNSSEFYADVKIVYLPQPTTED